MEQAIRKLDMIYVSFVSRSGLEYVGEALECIFSHPTCEILARRTPVFVVG